VQSEVGRVVGEFYSLNSKGEGLLKKVLGGDLNLTSQLVDAQTNLRALTARDSSMAQTQQGCVPNSTDSQSCWLSTQSPTVGANQP